MRRPVWHRDTGGWSGGWYPDNGYRQFSVLGQPGFAYSLTIMAPLVGDMTIEYRTQSGINAVVRHTSRHLPRPRRFGVSRRSLRELKKSERLTREANERLRAA